MKKVLSLLKAQTNKSIDSLTTEKILFNNLKWSFALQSSNIGVWDYNADTNIASFSEESLNIIGYNKEELDTNPDFWNNLVHPDDRTKYFEDFQKHLNGEHEIYENISRIKCKDGSYKWVLDKGKIISHLKDGKPKRIIGVHIDITESKKNEETLSKSITLIKKQNDKLKNFAHIATHNLKQHAGNFESLLEFYNEAKTIEEKDELTVHIKTVANSLKKTISNLRNIVSIDATKTEIDKSLNLRDYTNNSINTLNVEINRTKAIINNSIDRSITIEFNSAYLESVIQNLLTNALKYKHPERTPIININAIEHSNSIIFSVTDNGLGIDLDKYKEDLFGLYRTFHQNKDSEGVGLYLIKNQIESFGGRIEVTSTVNKGSTFTIIFPKN